MKRFRNEKGTVLVTAPNRKTRRKRSSRTKAFDLVAATHPASRAATQRSPADHQPQPEPLSSLLEENRPLRGELGSVSAGLRAERKQRDEKLAQLREEVAQSGTDAAELQRLRKVTEETAARLAALAAVEAESSELRGKLSARDKLIEQLRAKAERTGSLLEENRVVREELGAARRWLGKLETHFSLLMSERDGLAVELKRREEQLAQLRKEAVQSGADTAELERLRGVAQDTQARLAAAKVESLKLKTQVSARDKLLEQLRARAVRTSSLLGEKHTLKGNLQAARQRLAGLESSLAGLKTERDELSTELDRLRRTAEETAARLLALEAESSELRAQVSAKDRLAEQLRMEARNQADLAAESARLRERLAEAEQRVEDAEAKFGALLAERDELETELAKRGEGLKGVVEEIRAQVGRLDSVLDENHSLRCELKTRSPSARRNAKETRRTRKTQRTRKPPHKGADGPAT